MTAKTPLEQKRARRPLPLRSWVLLFFVVAGLLWLVPGTRSIGRRIFEPDRAFDSELWRAQEDNGVNYAIPTRESMVDDMLDSEVLIGLTRSEVQELLGPAFDPFEEELWFYYVGSAVIDSIVLEVTFGEGGVVTAARTFVS